MKLTETLRTINSAIFSLIIIAISAMLVYEWNKQGCSLYSLAAGLFFFNSIALGLWFAADQTLQGK